VTNATIEPAEKLQLATQYRVTDEADGSVVMHDVPLFAESDAPEGWDQSIGVGRFGLSWLKEDVRIAKSQAGYFAPMHFGHHDPDTPTKDRERAGKFTRDYVALRLVQGSPMWVSFGRLIFDSRSTYDRALRQFPYRSVEIVPRKPREINSLALLSDHAPFHRFPELKSFAADETDHIDPCWFAAEGEATAYFGATWRPLMAMGTVNDKSPAGSGDPDKPSTKTPPVNQAAEAEAQAGSDAEGEGESGGDEKVPPAEAEAESEGDGGMGDDDASPMTKKEGRAIYALLTKIAEATSGGGSASVQEKPPARAPVVAAHAQADEALAKAEAKNDVLADKIERIERKMKRDALAVQFAAEMAPFGRARQQAALERLDDPKRGPKVARAYVDAVKESGTPIPRGTPKTLQRDANEPKEVAAYAALGPDKHKQAREAASEYAANPMFQSVSLEDHIKYAVGGPGAFRAQ
jgi:hypothetical protein